MSFVHLRTHSEYSVVDGMLRIDAAAEAARADGQVALAITDLNNLFGAVQFYQACRGEGVKPIIGVDLWMEPEGGDKQPSRLLLLVQNMQGYLNLCELLARGWTRNAQRTQAWIKWAWLDELNEGLIALSGADGGVVGMALLAGDAPRAQALAQRLAQCFAGPLLHRAAARRPGHQRGPCARAVPLAAQLRLPVVATHPVQFLQAEDFEAHEARVCIAEGETLANPRRVKRFSAEQYFKTQAQMRGAVRRRAVGAGQQRCAIAQRCNLQLTLGKPQLPDFPIPDGMALEDVLPQGLARGPGAAPGSCATPTRPSANASARAMPSGWSSRSSRS